MLYILNEHLNILENILVNQKDIYYNKDKFDRGEINLCFILGHSGSGKTTMGTSMESDAVQMYQLDDLIYTKQHFSMENLKEYGDLIYSFFNTSVGKKYYITKEELQTDKIWERTPYDKVFFDFVDYAIKYAKSHKNIKFVIEGVELYGCFEPRELEQYAVYIKGTSMLISKIRAAKRSAKDATTNRGKIAAFVKTGISDLKFYITSENDITKWRKYYENK